MPKFSCHYTNVWAYLQQDEIVCMCERERCKTKGDKVQNNPVPSICVCVFYIHFFFNSFNKSETTRVCTFIIPRQHMYLRDDS